MKRKGMTGLFTRGGKVPVGAYNLYASLVLRAGRRHLRTVQINYQSWSGKQGAFGVESCFASEVVCVI
jgi:hypothetical protein